LTNLTNNDALDLNPVWSPDGKRIAFESNRAAFTQIYLMNADGSNVTQLTYDEIEHEMTMNYATSSPWSPDGSHLLFFQRVYGEKGSTPVPLELYSMDVNGGNKVLLASGNISFSDISWSPDGRYISYVLNDSPDVTRFVPNAYIVDANGTNIRELKKRLPQDEYVNIFYAGWSSDGRSVIFAAVQNDPLRQTLYEYNLETDTVLPKDVLRPSLLDWHNGISLITDIAREGSPFVWQRPNGTSNTLYLWRGWDDSRCGFDMERSLRGNFVIGTYCPNDNFWFYWANADGSVIQRFPDLKIHALNGIISGLTLSPDERFIAFNIAGSDETNLYIWDIEDALNDPSSLPIKILASGGDFNEIPAWQPVPNDNVEKENSTPEPLSFSLTVNEAETQAGFDVLEPSYLPSGYTLEGVNYDPETQKVVMKYVSQQNESTLFIYQQRGDLVHDPAMQTFVTPVPIGNVEGEYIQGAWIYDSPDTTTPRWDRSADHYSLSWQKGEIVYSIDFLGGETILPIQLNGLLDIAESLN